MRNFQFIFNTNTLLKYWNIEIKVDFRDNQSSKLCYPYIGDKVTSCELSKDQT